MGQKIVVGPITKGLRQDVEAFNIDNDSFPFLQNAYQWRGRIKRKRGTRFLTRLKRFFDSTSTEFNTGSTTITLAAVTGTGNLLTGFSLETNGNIVPGTVEITVGANVYTDTPEDGTLVNAGLVVVGTIDYGSGAIAIPTEAGNAASANFSYYPNLPVMGLEDFTLLIPAKFPRTIAFDTRYAYNINNNFPYDSNTVNFYNNPATADPPYPGYTQKSVWTSLVWNGQDYQQFWTVNYEGALWVTNGITVPFDITNIGMQFKHIESVTVILAGPPATANLNIIGHGLVVGDFVFINEVVGIVGINFQTGYVITVTDANNVIVEFPNANLVGAGTGGIAQYLTNNADPTVDPIRWYNGDPTSGTGNPNAFDVGWVNFSPPLSQEDFSIAGLPLAKYYLVGARMIVPFKGRLLFIGPVVQTSAANSQIYLQSTVICSQAGTPFYTSSFVDDPSLSDTIFHPILVPVHQTGVASAYFCDQTGFGFVTKASIDEPINTSSMNEDVLIFGFDTYQVRFVFTGNDIVPFDFYVINSEFGSSSTFSAINFDQAVMTRGDRGIIMSSQVEVKRMDIPIPDQVFEMNLQNNGIERITSQRDYINEWVYLTYPSNDTDHKFPNETLLYNYRDNSWAIFKECYTTYGEFIEQTGYTWQNIGTVYETWNSWDTPWNSGISTLFQPKVIAGNAQGFVLSRDGGTDEGESLTINNFSFVSTITGIVLGLTTVVSTVNTFIVGEFVTISGVLGTTQLNGNTYEIIAVTPTTITLDVDSTLFTPYISGGIATPLGDVYSPNHCLNDGDFIVIDDALGTISAQVNGRIFSVANPTEDYFFLNPDIEEGTYFGLGLIKRLYVPEFQTKQFPGAWGLSRKTRLGVQQYLLTTTAVSQITLLIFLSQNSEDPYNAGTIVPDLTSINNSLIYSTVLYTCPESSNLGLQPLSTNMLNPANTNLQMVTAAQQLQTWHRINTSLIGDTVQIGFVLSEEQMRNFTIISVPFVITDITAGTTTVLETNANLEIGSMVKITAVVGMIELNNNIYQVIANSSTEITIDVNSSGFQAYIKGGLVTPVAIIDQIAEIELHGIILDTSPSMVLA